MGEVENLEKKLMKNAEIAGIKHLLVQNLWNAKDELTKCLKTENKDKHNKRFKINMKQGAESGCKDHYHWIDVESQINGSTYKYSLGLCREDMDLKSGNIHQDFTKLQMSRCPYEASEAGGEVNPNPKYDDENYNCKLQYIASNCFPIAASNSDITRKNRNVHIDFKPWGYDNFVCKYDDEQKISPEEMSSEIMDRKNPKYDAKKVASFFLQLCAHDIEECEKAKRSEQAMRKSVPDLT